MLNDTLVLEMSERIRRPVDVVRAHFLDFDHHIANNVHAQIEYTPLSREGERQRLRAAVKVFGQKKVDEVVCYPTAGGEVVQDFVGGAFRGSRITLRFHEEDDGAATRVDFHFEGKLRGLNKLLRPLLKRTFTRVTRQTFEEDRVDLEERGYQPPADGSRPIELSARARVA